MNKLIKLANIFSSLGLYKEKYSILKLARETNKKYSNIARDISSYIYLNVSPQTLSSDYWLNQPMNQKDIKAIKFINKFINTQEFFVSYDVLKNIFEEHNLELSENGNEKLKSGLKIIIYPAISDESYE